MTNRAKSLYIHIPFCEAICDYCDFTKFFYSEKLAKEYLINLKKEVDSYSPNDVETIYIGGGTPTSLSDELFEELLNIVKPYSNKVKEYTIEANPESLTYNKSLLMKHFGVNRVSLGVESTNDKILKAINRKHDFEQVKTAISTLNNVGIDNINVDLIIGLPNVTKRLFLSDLENLVSLPIKHISCYSLTVHPHTVFFNKSIDEPNEDFSRELYDSAHNFLKDKGFIHYEISNWAKPGFESKHNLTYWRNEKYYGCGVSASGYLDNYRYKNVVTLDKYAFENKILEKEELTLKDERTYCLLTSLRTTFGLDLTSFKNLFNEDLLLSHATEVNELINNKFLLINNDHLIPTYEGMMVLDTILLKLI